MLVRNRENIIYIFILNVFLMIPAVLLPVFIKVFTDDILIIGKQDLLVPLLIFMIVLAFFSGGITWLESCFLLRLSNKIEFSGASRYFGALINSPLALFNKTNSALLVSKINATSAVSKTIAAGMLKIIVSIVSVAFYMIMMLFVDTPLSFVLAGVVVLNVVLLALQGKFFEKLSKSSVQPHGCELENKEAYKSELKDRLEVINSSGLHNIETFKSTASETFFFQRLLNNNISLSNANKTAAYEEAYAPVKSFSSVVFLNLLLFISAVRIMDKTFSIGSYLAFQKYSGSFFYPLNNLLSFKKITKQFKMNLDDLSDEDLPEYKERTNIVPLAKQKLSGRIECKNISFGYDGKDTFIKDFNLSLKPGQKIAITGAPGAGKSTVAKLLLGLYEPLAGEITFDGIPLTQIDKRLFLNSVGYAGQEVALFSATVHDNITLWDEQVSEEEVYAVAASTCIHDYITTLDGAYKHMLSENSNSFSSGQKKQLEIARALLYNPSVVIFDEATSAIDPHAAAKIKENLTKRGCACISITHTLAGLKDYDEIIVMRGGRIIQRGAHEELLLEESGYYASLFQMETPESLVSS